MNVCAILTECVYICDSTILQACGYVTLETTSINFIQHISVDLTDHMPGASCGFFFLSFVWVVLPSWNSRQQLVVFFSSLKWLVSEIVYQY